MAFDFAKAKADARRAVHTTLGVAALYKDSTMSAPAPVVVRWHNSQMRVGDIGNEGYAEVIEGIDHVVFSATEARALNVKAGGTITITGLALGGVAAPEFKLRVKLPEDGPFEEEWEVA